MAIRILHIMTVEDILAADLTDESVLEVEVKPLNWKPGFEVAIGDWDRYRKLSWEDQKAIEYHINLMVEEGIPSPHRSVHIWEPSEDVVGTKTLTQWRYDTAHFDYMGHRLDDPHFDVELDILDEDIYTPSNVIGARQ